MTPRDFYGYWPELEIIEVGERAAHAYDEASPLEHRLCRANGLTYGCPPRHWGWVQQFDGSRGAAHRIWQTQR